MQVINFVATSIGQFIVTAIVKLATASKKLVIFAGFKGLARI